MVLHYQSAERRTERMAGGVPGWTWAELGPMVRDLDALYLNFISGFELTLGTAQALRQGFDGPIYADLHSLFLGMQHDGMRVLRPLPDAAAWFGCFDVVQLNEDEMRQLSPDPLTLAAEALGAGVSPALVTLGPRARRTWRHRGSTDRRSGGRRPACRAAPCHRALRAGRPPPSVDASIPPAAATCSAPRRAPGCSPATRWKTRSATPTRRPRATPAFRGADRPGPPPPRASW